MSVQPLDVVAPNAEALSPGVISLAGLVFNVRTRDTDRQPIDELVCDTIAGWHDGPAVRGEVTPRPGQHGDFSARILREGRTVTMSGWCWAHTRARTHELADQLAAILAEGFYDTFTFRDDDSGERSASVRLADVPTITWNTYKELFEWQLVVHADDPRKYGATTVQEVSAATAPGASGGLSYDDDGSGDDPDAEGAGLDYNSADRPGLVYLDVPGSGGGDGTFTVANNGTAAYWPRFRLEGPVSNPYLVNLASGAWLRIGLDVSAGSWLDIDCATRQVLADGYADRRWAVTYSGDWLAIEPGGATLRWTDDLHDPDSQLWVWTSQGAWW